MAGTPAAIGPLVEPPATGPSVVGREYSFSSFRVRGWWRGVRSGVRILQPPDDAPQAVPAQAANQHPHASAYSANAHLGLARLHPLKHSVASHGLDDDRPRSAPGAGLATQRPDCQDNQHDRHNGDQHEPAPRPCPSCPRCPRRGINGSPHQPQSARPAGFRPPQPTHTGQRTGRLCGATKSLDTPRRWTGAVSVRRATPASVSGELWRPQRVAPARVRVVDEPGRRATSSQ
jgi:hypothetical protein